LSALIGVDAVAAATNDTANAGDSPAEIAHKTSATASAGVEYRSRWEWTDGDEREVAGLHRLLAHGSPQGTAARAFVELGLHSEEPASRSKRAARALQTAGASEVNHLLVQMEARL
jgi:hypothetical protein